MYLLDNAKILLTTFLLFFFRYVEIKYLYTNKQFWIIMKGKYFAKFVNLLNFDSFFKC